MKTLILVVLAFKLASSELDWWQKTVFYQIYPRSFKDSGSDGIGDLQGIISKLSYLKDAGIQATWLSPIFKSPQVDYGYDISDYRTVDPLFGTNADLEELIAKATELGIKIILDFVPNHTSDEHEWFQKSIKREGNYTDYYVWRDGKDGGPPNNWISGFYGSAWKWNEERGQYYYHMFAEGQPDLNYRSPNVVNDMQEVLKYWLSKGVGGFRVDAVQCLFEAEDFRDEPLSGKTNDSNTFDYLLHHFTQDLPETYDIVYGWRKLLDQWKTDNGGDSRVMMTEAWANTSVTMQYYENSDKSQQGSQMPFNFVLMTDLGSESTAADFKRVIDERLSAIPAGHVANWVMGNHDRPRVGSRYGAHMIDNLMTLVTTIPGVAITYNGDEIGMVDYRTISYGDTLDPAACNGPAELYQTNSRDPVRTPFQWDDTTYAGFSSAKPWLPVNPNYKDVNLATQTSESVSTFKLYQELVLIRQNAAFLEGSYLSRVFKDTVLTYVRKSGSDEYVVVISFTQTYHTINLKELSNSLADTGEVVLVATSSAQQKGNKITTSSVAVGPYDTFIISYSSAGTIGLSFVAFFILVLRLLLALF